MDQGGFETLVAAHHREIYRYLLRATGRASDAADLSQETFLRAYRAFPALPPGANTRAWLFAIATNLSRNHFRAQRRRRMAYAAVSATGREAVEAGPEVVALSREAHARLESAVERLPFQQRAAFLQRKVHGLDYGAIAQSLRCSPEAARAHVFQALRKIRRALNGEGEEGRR